MYSVELASRSDLPADFFDPRSLGYVPPQEAELAILDDPALGVRVYWPGRTLSGTPGFDAQLDRIERRQAQQVGRGGPGQVLTISYAGSAGRFRLDYWPSGNWEAFQSRLGDALIWNRCGERRSVSGGPGEIIIYRGFEPASVPLPQAMVAGSPPPPTPDLFPGGCPTGPHDRFMAEVRFPGVTVTINAPYGIIGQSSQDFGDYDTEVALEEIAKRLRPRQQGE